MINRYAYDMETDFDRVSDFLFSLYQPENRDGNCFQSIWEYSYTHPYTDLSLIDKVGIWQDGDDIVGVVFFETELMDAFFNVHPDYQHIKPDMLSYAQEHLTYKNPAGDLISRVFISEYDDAFLKIAESQGYKRMPDKDRPMSIYEIPNILPSIQLPEGFTLNSMAVEDDLYKMHRVLWRGFNHPGEPPEAGIAGRRRMQSGPHYRKDLAIVVQNPAGDFVSFCGMWYDAINRFGYVEPVATDPDCRQVGLGRAAVLEGIRRCGKLGATVAYVWSDRAFYTAIGFRTLYSHLCFEKKL